MSNDGPPPSKAARQLGTVEELVTPSLVIDIDTARRNAVAMLERARRLRVRLRPHVKTHKTVEGALLQTGGRRSGIVVSTLAEAEHFADNGFDDILYAVLITGDKCARAQALTDRLERFHVMLDSKHALDFLEAAGSGKKRWSVWLNVDSGYHRDGLDPQAESSVALARSVHASKCCTLAGLYTHAGHSYNETTADGVRAVAASERDAVVELARRIRGCGIDCPEVTVGSTPTCSVPPAHLDGITEMHPGNYLLYDCTQIAIGACSPGDIAVRVLTRVIGRNTDRQELVVDAGWTALTQQGKEMNYGEIENAPGLRIKRLSQETGIVAARDGYTFGDGDFPLGSLLRIRPYHACAVGAMHPVYYVVEGETVIDTWSPVRGW